MENAGPAIVFLFALVGGGIVGIILATYVCHCFLHVLTESAAGIIESRWPDESIGDWWWKPLYCGGLLSIWLLVVAILVGPFLIRLPLVFAMVYALVLSVLYPVSVLSALHAHSPFMIVEVGLVYRLLRHPRALLLVIIATIPLLLLSAALVVGTLRHTPFWAFGAALVLPPALLLWTRAWGRLAWLANADRPQGRPRKERPARSAALAVDDPWAESESEPELPELDVEVVEPDGPEDEWSPFKKPYELTQDLERPRPMLADHYKDHARRRRAKWRQAEGRRSVERVTATRPATWQRALGTAFVGYLFYQPVLKVWLNLSLLLLVELLFVYLIVTFWMG